MRLNQAFDLSFTQSEVDFVVPDLTADLPLAIDPFLLFKSRDDNLRTLHDQLLSIFNRGVRSFREGDRDELNWLIDFPEVDEIGFGYSARKIKGSGLGWLLNRLLAETLAASPALQERGLRHVEELQLVSINVGPDRVSDLAGNVLKSYLIEYTQQQAALWNIPLTPGLPIAHFFDFEAWEWADGYFDLPRNPVSGLPIILVPRRIVRLLPWINYDDYARTDYHMYLHPSKGPRKARAPGVAKEKRADLLKKEVVEVTRSKLDLLDRYIHRKEREASGAEPALPTEASSESAAIARGEQFVARLQALPTGQKTAGEYQRLVYEIFNYLFEPDLTDGQLEVATHLGTERRDIVYTNEAERSFLAYVRGTYGSMFLMLEIKNVAKLELEHVNQTSAYLGTRLGMLGFIVTRNVAEQNIFMKTYAIFNDTPSVPRKTILVATDDDLVAMIRLKQEGKQPVKHLQDIYRRFQFKIQ